MQADLNPLQVAPLKTIFFVVEGGTWFILFNTDLSFLAAIEMNRSGFQRCSEQPVQIQ